jgi:hypothetical protein
MEMAKSILGYDWIDAVLLTVFRTTCSVPTRRSSSTAAARGLRCIK